MSEEKTLIFWDEIGNQVKYFFDLGDEFKIKKEWPGFSIKSIQKQKGDEHILIDNIYRKIESFVKEKGELTSKQILRWKKKPCFSLENGSPKVTFERMVVNSPSDQWLENTDNKKWRDKWTNQVPLSSGLFNSSGGRRCIDLVKRCKCGEFQFIELKVGKKEESGGSDFPLFAAIEILTYSIIYLFLRINQDELGLKSKKESEKLLKANNIHLKVLAQKEYYKKDKELLRRFSQFLTKGLDKYLSINNPGLKMDFDFQQFPEDFCWNPEKLTEVEKLSKIEKFSKTRKLSDIGKLSDSEKLSACEELKDYRKDVKVKERVRDWVDGRKSIFE